MKETNVKDHFEIDNLVDDLNDLDNDINTIKEMKKIKQKNAHRLQQLKSMDVKLKQLEIDETKAISTTQYLEEEPWTDNFEALAWKYRQECKDSSKEHTKAYAILRRQHLFLGLPPILIPLIMAAVTNLIDNSEVKDILNTFALLFSGIAGSVYRWLDLGKTNEVHNSFSVRYIDICNDIDFELSRDANFRQSADVFLTAVKLKKGKLDEFAPDVDDLYICSCNSF